MRQVVKKKTSACARCTFTFSCLPQTGPANVSIKKFNWFGLMDTNERDGNKSSDKLLSFRVYVFFKSP